jgi:hypothetical protein
MNFYIDYILLYDRDSMFTVYTVKEVNQANSWAKILVSLTTT